MEGWGDGGNGGLWSENRTAMDTCTLAMDMDPTRGLPHYPG